MREAARFNLESVKEEILPSYSDQQAVSEAHVPDLRRHHKIGVPERFSVRTQHGQSGSSVALQHGSVICHGLQGPPASLWR